MIEYNSGLMIVSTALFGVLGLVFAGPKILRMIKNQLEKYYGARLLGENYYKHFVQFQVDPKDNLTCRRCNTQNVEVTYECGHLSTCFECHKKIEDQHQDLVCPVCKKKSNSYERLYFA